MQAYTVTLTDTNLLNFAHGQAEKLHVSVSDYVNHLIIREKQTAPEQVPAHVMNRWKKEIAEFEAAEQKKPRPVFTSGAEYVAYIRHKS